MGDQAKGRRYYVGADVQVQRCDQETQLPDQPKPSEGLVHQGYASLDTTPPHPAKDRQLAGCFGTGYEDRGNGEISLGI